MLNAFKRFEIGNIFCGKHRRSVYQWRKKFVISVIFGRAQRSCVWWSTRRRSVDGSHRGQISASDKRADRPPSDIVVARHASYLRLQTSNTLPDSWTIGHPQVEVLTDFNEQLSDECCVGLDRSSVTSAMNEAEIEYFYQFLRNSNKE
jgi:hypothetical protein